VYDYKFWVDSPDKRMASNRIVKPAEVVSYNPIVINNNHNNSGD